MDLHKIQYFWAEPDEPPSPAPPSYNKDEAFAVEEVLSVPQLNEIVTLELAVPYSISFLIFPTIVHGKVKKVIQVSRLEFNITLERVGRTGFNYQELCACIGTRMIGYHQTLGRVEGKLLGLFPDKFELAVLEVPELNGLHKFLQAESLKTVELELDEEERQEILDYDQDTAVVISWSSVTKLVVE